MGSGSAAMIASAACAPETAASAAAEPRRRLLMFIFDLQSKFRMGLGSFAEGQRSLPHPRRFLEDGRSTASLPELKIQDAGGHAIVNCRQAVLFRPLTGGLLRKGHKYGGAPAGNLHFIKKILNRQALRRAFRSGSGCPAAQIPPDSCRKGTIASRSGAAVRGKLHRHVPG